MPPITSSRTSHRRRKYVCDACRSAHRQCPHSDPLVEGPADQSRPRSIKPRSLPPNPAVRTQSPEEAGPSGLNLKLCNDVISEFICSEHFEETYWIDNFYTFMKISSTLRHAVYGLCLFHLFEGRETEAYEQVSIAMTGLLKDTKSKNSKIMEISILSAGVLGISHFCAADSLRSLRLHVCGVVSIMGDLMKGSKMSKQLEGFIHQHRPVIPATQADVLLHWNYVSPFFEQHPETDFYSSQCDIGSIQDILSLVVSSLKCSFEKSVQKRIKLGIKNVHHLSRVLGTHKNRSNDFCEVFEQSVYGLAYMCVYPTRTIPSIILQELMGCITVAEAKYGSLMFPRLVLGWHTKRELPSSFSHHS